MTSLLAKSFLILIVFALSALAIPIIAHGLAASPDRPNPYPSHMTPKLIFDIVFGLLLFIAVLASYLCLAGCSPAAPLKCVVEWIRAAPGALKKMWDFLRPARPLEGSPTRIADGNGATNDTSTTQGGSISNTAPTASH